jgi:predicted DNA-binding transcriptional regulator YafY
MPGDTKDVQTLRQAILSTRTVRFRYHARHSAHTEPDSIREVDPYSLTYVKDTWQLLGYCHLRQDMRMFRISRMADLTVLNQPFDRAEHLEMWQQTMAGMSQPRYPFTATLAFDNEVARWVQEDPNFYIVDRQSMPDGLCVRLRAPDARAALQWILSWGQHVRIVEPESLRALLINETQAALARWKSKI